MVKYREKEKWARVVRKFIAESYWGRERASTSGADAVVMLPRGCAID